MNKDIINYGLMALNGKSSLFEMNLENDVSNIGFRLSYFLWILRGSNSLEELNFYSNHVNGMSDDMKSLRGAYGPRMRYWIGADQLQEAINVNIDVDKSEDFKKPVGVDQIQKAMEDLKAGMLSTCISIFDPSIDFEDTRDVPCLSNIILYKTNEEKELNIMCNYIDFNTDKHQVNDLFFLHLFHNCMCSVLGLEKGLIVINSAIRNFGIPGLFTKDKNEFEDCRPENKDPESLLKDIETLCDFERHYRNGVNEFSTRSNEVDIIEISEDRIKKFLDNLSCKYWKEYGLTLAAFILIKYGGYKHLDYIEENVLTRMTSKFKYEVERMITNVRNGR